MTFTGGGRIATLMVATALAAVLCSQGEAATARRAPKSPPRPSAVKPRATTRAAVKPKPHTTAPTATAPARPTPPQPPAAPALPPLELAALVAQAIEDNPELQAMRREIAAREAAVPQARALMDPMLEVRLANMMANNLSLNEDPMSGIEIMLRQQVPYPGKRSLRGEMAQSEAAMTVEQYRSSLFDVVARVKRSYYNLWQAEQIIAIIQLTQGSVKDIAKIAEEKYAVGLGLQQDVLRAQLEVSRILNEMLMWQREREGARAELNAALGRSPESPLGPAAKVEKTEVPLSLSSLQQTALTSSPMLRERNIGIRRAQAEEALAVKELKPDFEFGLGYMFRSRIMGEPMSGTDMISASVGLNLPIYARTKQRKRIEETRSDLEAARARREAAQVEIFSMLADLKAEADRNSRQIDLYRRGIIPQAELAFESARAGYQVGKIDFLALLDAQMRLYEYQIAYYQSLAAYQRALAEIERTAGTTLF